jgi:hypothetical protein
MSRTMPISKRSTTASGIFFTWRAPAPAIISWWLELSQRPSSWTIC